MPSNVVAQVSEIKDIRPHENADLLELATLNGWQIVCGKGLYKEGERVLYVTPDSLITEELADILKIRQYLSSVKNSDGTFVTNDKGEIMLRVRQARLRGEISFGTTIPANVMSSLYGIDIGSLELGTNLAEEIVVLKYEPPMRSTAGDTEKDHTLFVKYTSIENLRNYPQVLEDGEEVVIFEKIHGQNLRVGLIEGEFMAGSHGLRRKRPENPKTNSFWYVLEIPEVVNLLESLGKEHKQAILFGESYGNIQKKYTYDKPNGVNFRAFDLLVDGKYLNYYEFLALTEEFNVPIVPRMLNMAYDFNNIIDCIEGVKSSFLNDNHPMEGVVIRPIKERYDHKVGRVILKYITNSYMFDKNGTDFLDV